MATVKIYGASDDLVEVEGGCAGCNEYNAIDTVLFIEFSTGDVWEVEYTSDGVWEVNSHAKGVLQNPPKGTKGVSITKEPHGEGDDPEPHTETLTVTGPFQWVEAWEVYPPDRDEYLRKIEEAINDGERLLADDLSDDDVRAVWLIVAAAKRRK